MKNKKRSDNLLIVMLIILIVIPIIMFFVRLINGKNLKIDNELVVELHNFFNTEDLGLCGGLFNYSEEKIKYDDISIETKKCLAYQKADIKNIEEETYNSDKGKNTCTQEDMIFRTDENSNKCTITKIDRNIIDDTFKKLFGKDIKDNDSVKVDNSHICYVKDDYYYCGLSETITYVIGAESTIYKVIQKAVEKSNTVEIYDYFVKINENTCYKTYTTATENSNCTEEYKNNQNINYSFMKKYATRYKHVFKKIDKDTYYWLSSEPLN